MTDRPTTDELPARWRSEQWWMFHLPPAAGLVGLSQLMRVMRPYYGQTTCDEFTVFMNRSRDDIWVTVHKRRMTPAQLHRARAPGSGRRRGAHHDAGRAVAGCQGLDDRGRGALLKGAPPGAIEAAVAFLVDPYLVHGDPVGARIGR